MDASEALAARRLGFADVDAGLALSTAAGWNQTDADWALFMRHAEVFGHEDAAGTVIATAAALPYGRLGWIAMVLVHRQWQRRGLATQLLDDCVRALQRLGVTPLLDATPDGAVVYERIGFHRGFSFTRWQGAAAARTAPMPTGVRRALAQDCPALCALDHETTGLERAFVLRDILERPDTWAFMREDASGFIIARAGVRATQIGPLVARRQAGAEDLLDAALEQTHGPVFLDVPDAWQGFTDTLARRGFAAQRPFVRMAKASGAALAQLRPDERQFALAGPEFG